VGSEQIAQVGGDGGGAGGGRTGAQALGVALGGFGEGRREGRPGATDARSGRRRRRPAPGEDQRSDG
jgi:hypothetical protein